MLKPIASARTRKAGGTFAIVASKYNTKYVDAMLRAATAELKRAGAKVKAVRVPGAFEIPAVAAKLSILDPRPSAILCFGVIFQGQTSHAQHIGWGVTHALAQIQIQHKTPVIHAVFVFENEEHAKVRCLGRKHNRGREAAHTALEMARIFAGLNA
jgi:6,7-dimethyl-8-ribityllumazine synthase